MKNYKRIISSFLALALIMSCMVIPASASDLNQNQTYEIEVGIINEEDFDEYVASLERMSLAQRGNSGIAVMSISRSGNTTNCDVFFFWTGYMISAFRHGLMTIKSTSVFPVIYDYLGAPFTYTTLYTPASTVCTIHVGRIQIPTDVDTAKISYSGTEVYGMPEAAWFPVIFAGAAIPIN